MDMREVQVQAIPMNRLAALLPEGRARLLREVADRARVQLAGRVVWNVNATAQGGGVAEMLQVLLAYGRGEGVDTRWLVLDGDPDFFMITKRLHNLLHGMPGDGGLLGEAERAHYVEVLETARADLAERVRPGDIVLLHDPQPAGLVDGVRAMGAHAVWRSHIGRDMPNGLTEWGWSFLRPFVERADGFILSRLEYSPGWVPPERRWVIPPSIDPFSTKNADIAPADVDAALRRAGLLDAPFRPDGLTFTRRDGSPGQVRPHSGLVLDGAGPPPEARVVLQVSRWDRLKDMAGVLVGFGRHIAELPDDVHLMLVGPDVGGVADDPEGSEVLAECRALWRDRAAAVRERIHLVALPMDDVDENGHLVNALQRHASVVVQKSLVEGFGLTVTEAMWKARPVIASALGGIQDQIVDGESGLLLPDPADLAAFVLTLRRPLEDSELAAQLGARARARVLDRFLGDRHLIQYAELFAGFLAEETAAGGGRTEAAPISGLQTP
jgi:trehalose synthase